MAEIDSTNFEHTRDCWVKILAQVTHEHVDMTRGLNEDGTAPREAYADTICEVMGMSTYDPGASWRIAPALMAVVAAIFDQKTFEYIEVSNEQNDWYLVVCSLSGLAPWLSWGTSIRGAQFYPPDNATAGKFISGISFYDIPIENGDQLRAAFGGLIDFYNQYIVPELLKDANGNNQAAE